jgi:hypothetical protein
MTISQVNAGFTSSTQTPLRFFMPGAKEFAGNLNLGQILKGKVLRQYDGSRYLVNFDGQERVVDSALPLRTGELLHGRVIAIGDRVEMQRVYSDDETAVAAQTNDTAGLPSFTLNPRDAQLQTLIDRYQVRFSEADRAVLLRAARSVDDATAMAQAGVFLNKLGINQSDELLQMLYARLKGTTAETQAFNDWLAMPQLETTSATQAAGLQGSTIRQLADIIGRAAGTPSEHHDENPTDAAPSAPLQQIDDPNKAVQGVGFRPDRDDGDASNRLAHWVLNAQTGGSVMHRLGTLPLLLGGRLIEVDVAMFEQRRDAVQKTQAQHRQLVFTLQTEHLGRVEVVARVVGDRVRVSVATDDEKNTAVAASHVQALKTSLAEAGWMTDEVSYETRTVDERTGAVSSVIEHVISLDSMNRLV